MSAAQISSLANEHLRANARELLAAAAASGAVQRLLRDEEAKSDRSSTPVARLVRVATPFLTGGRFSFPPRRGLLHLCPRSVSVQIGKARSAWGIHRSARRLQPQ
jgi:hypothetical protein